MKDTRREVGYLIIDMSQDNSLDQPSLLLQLQWLFDYALSFKKSDFFFKIRNRSLFHFCFVEKYQISESIVKQYNLYSHLDRRSQ
jgi:hypothetical protein